MIRSERNDALDKLFIRNLQTNEEEELKIIDETVIVLVHFNTKR